MRIGLMVEGQNGVTWERWSHILALAERLKFPTVFRSDHYFIGKQQDSLEAYLSFVMAARETSTIRFGPLVSPMTFRSPVDVGRMAAQIDLLSGGRFVMGLGAGWNEPEHVAYGIPFPSLKERMDRLEEGIQVVRAMWAPGPASFDGKYYRLEGAECLPKPSEGRPPIIIGGGGEKRTLRMAARYAAEWNGVNMTPKVLAHKVSVLAQHCEGEGRDPATIRKSMMCFGLVHPTQAGVDRLVERFAGRIGPAAQGSIEEKRAAAKARGMITGTTDEVVEQLKRLEELGLDEVQFQHFDFDSDEVPEYLAAEIAPRVG
ncbi:MAG: LLM class F420-dependent oxidoreductase [Tepidiformaceae bacterium]